MNPEAEAEAEFDPRNAGWSFGFTGDAPADAVNVIERELGRPLTPAEREALEAGHAEGVRDRASYAEDMARHPPPAWAGVPW